MSVHGEDGLLKLLDLPDSIGKLVYLKELHLDRCSNLTGRNSLYLVSVIQFVSVIQLNIDFDF